jgi:hypothetical protein
MHATVQELITLRDGELVSADVVQHVATCRDCHAEFARLLRLRERLRELPGFQPPAFDAAELAARAARAERRPALSRIAVPLVAASLGVVAFITLTQSVFRNPVTSATGAAAAATAAATATTTAQQQPGPAREPSAAVQQLMARSQRLEAALQELPQRPAVEHVATSSAIDALQARIQLLDAQLAAAAGGMNPEQSYALWNDRVQLLNSLVGVRYAEATRDSYLTTSRGVI